MEVVIKKGNAEARVSSHGGEMTAFSVKGKEILWRGEEKYWGEHSPVLFPFVSGLHNGETEIEGKTYQMPLHGFARFEEFSLVEQKQDSVTFSLSSNGKLKQMYPFDFTLFVTQKVSESGFETIFTVRNDGEKVLPFCIGAHPGFTVGNLEEWYVEFEKEETGDFYYTADRHMNEKFISPVKFEKRLDFKYSYFDNDALIAIKPNSNKMVLAKNDQSEKIEFSYYGFNVFAMWTPEGVRAPFICLEPWNGLPPYMTDSPRFEDKHFIEKLNKGETYTCGIKAEIK